jgi:hypothetical protein
LSTVAEHQGNMGTSTYQYGYTYDRWGNRFQSANATLGLPSVSSAEIEKTTNRFINSGATPTSYDAAGNIITDTKFRNLKYEYDANGRQHSVKLINDTTIQTAVYDSGGLRVQTTANGVTRTMVYDIFGQQVTDYNGASLERENIYRSGQLVATAELGTASTPSSLAAASATGNVALSWSAATGASNYRVERKASLLVFDKQIKRWNSSKRENKGFFAELLRRRRRFVQFDSYDGFDQHYGYGRRQRQRLSLPGVRGRRIETALPLTATSCSALAQTLLPIRRWWATPRIRLTRRRSRRHTSLNYQTGPGWA